MTLGTTSFDIVGPDAGAPIVLIHGLGLSREIWNEFLPRLSAEHRVLLYDLYGHGQSEPAPEKMSLEAYAVQLHRLMDQVGMESAVVIGFSLGGMINRKLAMMAPERVRALGILNSPHERTPESQARVETQADQSARGGPGATVDSALARWFTDGFREEHEDVVEAVRAQVLSCDPPSYADARSVLAHGVKELIAPEPPLTCLTLIATSENDTGSTPGMARAMQGEIAGSELEIVPEVKHLGLLERPEVFGRMLWDFLERVAAGETPAARRGAAV
ncbi:MAG: alpha/beta hydrolase [Roseovarius sp.]